MNTINLLVKKGNKLLEKIASDEILLESLPRGSIFINKVGKESFAYRKRKYRGKTLSTYLGNIKSEKVKNEIREVKRYKELKHSISEEKKEFAELIKLIKMLQHKKTNFINKKILIDFDITSSMSKLINKAEQADVLNNYGIYMNYVYAIDSQAKKETTNHIITESQWNKLMMRYCL